MDGGVDVTLRRADGGDAAGVADVYVSSWNEGFGGRMPPRTLDAGQVARWEHDLSDDRCRWWVALAEGPIEGAAVGVVVGVVGTGPSRGPVEPGLGELDTIAVAPSAWRQSVGRRLMGVAIDDLREAGCRGAVLWTLAGHAPTQAFYLATGWHPSGESRDSGRQVAMRRSLTPD